MPPNLFILDLKKEPVLYALCRVLLPPWRILVYLYKLEVVCIHNPTMTCLIWTSVCSASEFCSIFWRVNKTCLELMPQQPLQRRCAFPFADFIRISIKILFSQENIRWIWINLGANTSRHTAQRLEIPQTFFYFIKVRLLSSTHSPASQYTLTYTLFMALRGRTEKWADW